MNYYVSAYRNCSDSVSRRIVESADEIVSLYMAGRNLDSLRKTQSFLAYLEQYLTGKQNNRFSFCTPAVIEALSKRFRCDKDDVMPISNEFYLAVGRVKNLIYGEHIDSFGFDHNARFVDWVLVRCLRWVNETESVFNASNKEYLTSSERFFQGGSDEERKYNGRIKLFYRNAYRAEMYSHKLYTDINSKGTYDMYTPLILSRMAVEQYLKYMYELKISREAPSKPSECREELEKKKIISMAFSNEIWAMLKRGNANTHDGFAGYVFANMHCIAVLKKCWKELQTH